MLPLITPLLLLQVGAGAYILDRIMNSGGEDEKEEGEQENDKTDNPEVDDRVNVVNNKRRDECINDQRRADSNHAKIWRMIEVRRLEANGRLRMIETNKANMSNQHKDIRSGGKPKPIVGIPEQRIRKIPIIDEASISMQK